MLPKPNPCLGSSIFSSKAFLSNLTVILHLRAPKSINSKYVFFAVTSAIFGGSGSVATRLGHYSSRDLDYLANDS